MKGLLGRLEWDRVAGLLVVLAFHGAVLYGLWSVRVIPPPADAVTLFVNFISPPIPQSEAVPPPTPPKPKPVKRDRPRPVKSPHTHLAAQVPVTSPEEPVEPLPTPDATEIQPPPEPPAPVPTPPGPQAPVPAPSRPAEPVTLASELAVTCTQRTLPPYPRRSRRLGETGEVVLRIELDETGSVSAAQIVSSSGFERLDAAALAAVRSWRCTPAQRDGQAVRSVATQPFKFTLEGR